MARLLEKDQLRVIKVIRLYDEICKITSFLIYKRYLTENYNSETSDMLDNAIIGGIKPLYKKVELVLSQNLLFSNTELLLMNQYACEVKLPFKIHFNPTIEFQNYEDFQGITFPTLDQVFNLYPRTNSDNENIRNLRLKAYAVYSVEKMEEFNSLLSSIDETICD
jgi:hypothetical protein